MNDARVPADLLREVRRDLHPVRPLASPARRAMWLVPVVLALFIGLPAWWGWRSNLPQLDASWLGLATAWGLSGLQALSGWFVAGVALREAVPGRGMSSRAVTATFACALSLVVIVTALTSIVLPTVTPHGVWLRFAWECAGAAIVTAAPGIAMIAWLVSRALPPRPAMTGALYGLGAGLMADAGMRLYCWVSDPAHVLLAHGGAIAVMMAIGAALSVSIERLRRP